MSPKETELPTGIINPFSDSFLEQWAIWKAYRWSEHKFKYKGLYSEQAALMKLNDLSAGDEEIAKAIIKQSIEGPWKGFFPLHKNNSNGQPVTKEATRKDVTEILGSRNYERR